uniref:CCHC-type domain-containing protein n=1 Tax=Fagus sylvatica TaxID=28930 RepID=A0A2N9FT32_FAGSY
MDTDMSDRPKVKIRASGDKSGHSHEDGDSGCHSNKKMKDTHAIPTGEMDIDRVPIMGGEALERKEPISPFGVRICVSYKESLLGELPRAYEQAFFGNGMEDDGGISSDDDDDIEPPEEGEVVVKFSRELKQRIREPWSTSLIIKVFGRSVGYMFLVNKLKYLWKVTGNFSCVDLGLDLGSLDFRASEAVVSSVAVWVRLSELPVEYYQKDSLMHIGKELGPVLHVDYNTAAGTRGRFAHICIQLDLDKPQVRTVRIGKTKLAVVYEGIGLLCFHCGKIGHQTDRCPTGAQTILTHPPCSRCCNTIDHGKAVSHPAKAAGVDADTGKDKLVKEGSLSHSGLSKNQGRSSALSMPHQSNMKLLNITPPQIPTQHDKHQMSENSLSAIAELRFTQYLEEVYCATLPEFEERKVILSAPIKFYWQGNRASLKMAQAAKAVDLAKTLPFDGFLCTNTIGFAGGIWVMWNLDLVDVEHLCSTEQEIHVSVKVRGSNTLWLLSAIYASPRRFECRILWNNLSVIVELHNLPWRKKRVLARMSGVQGALASNPSDSLSRLEKSLREQYLNILNLEENGFSDLFTTSHVSSLDGICLPLWAPRISDAEALILLTPVTARDVKDSLWSFKPFKAPGPDGLHPGFFQRCWPQVGESVVKEVCQIFSSGRMPEYLNKTLIALIPKCNGPETLNQFRPISLCNTVYKIVTKIIVSRIRPLLSNLISPFQTAFIPGKKRLEWSFIREVLLFFNFPTRDKSWKPIKASRSGPAFSHLFFADDLLLCAEASVGCCYTIARVLDDFCSHSGQKINLTKSKGFFSPNVAPHMRQHLCDILGVASTSDLGKYSGIPSPVECSICSELDKINMNFLWGSTEEKKKMHMVGWDKICRPKKDGGLSFSAAKPRNIALLAKLNWRLVEEKDSLWAKTLLAKYCPNGPLEINERTSRSGSSNWRDPLREAIQGPIPPFEDCFCVVDVIEGEDSIAWDSSDGGFSLGKAYQLARNHQNVVNGSKNSMWLWKVKTSPRIVFFLWQCYHDSVPVWDTLASRANCSSTVLRANSIPWQTVFAFGVWTLWIRRNQMVFKAGSILPDLVVCAFSHAAEFFYLVDFKQSSKNLVPILVKWIPPSVNWAKLNTDGLVMGELGLAGGGGVIQDYLGNWVGVFSRSIGITSSVQAELRALKDGLQLALDLEIPNLEIEMDSAVAVKLLHSTNSSNAFLSSIVNDCRYLLERFEAYTLKHIYREANGCADTLAKAGCVQHSDFLLYTSAPAHVLEALDFDISVATCSRLVSA